MREAKRHEVRKKKGSSMMERNGRKNSNLFQVRGRYASQYLKDCEDLVEHTYFSLWLLALLEDKGES